MPKQDAYDIDALLKEAARQETEEANLPHILERVRALAPARTARRPRSRLRLAAIPAAAALLLLLIALMRPVKINGKTFLAFQDKVTIGGITRKLGAPDENGLLLQIENSNQYVDLDKTGAASPETFVFPMGASPVELKNPNAVPGKGATPESLAPVTVFPIVGDLAVREGPDTAYAALGELYSGQCVTKVGIVGNWAILQWREGVAYAFNAYLYELPAQTLVYLPVVRYATEPVNVRALPTSRDLSAVLYELKADEKVVCTGRIGEWSQIEWNGQKAYVFTKYLREGGFPDEGG